MLRSLAVGLLFPLLFGSASAGEFQYKQRLLGDLVKQVPGILRTFDAKTGRFGSGIWICRDQQEMYPLAVAYATAGPGNKYYEDPKLLAVIAKAGDALIDDMDAHGQWVFRKKDGSTWGMTRMCWTYSRWIRTFALVGGDFPPAARERWTKALTLGYSEIAKHDVNHLHNIPTHQAMGLYVAGKALGRPEWCRQAAEFMPRIVAAQAEGGYWAEGQGPVVLYNFVYLEALAIYRAASGDRRVLDALERGTRFHARFTYPSGQCVETIDQRNPYHDRPEAGNVAFTFTPEGRAYLAQQWKRLGRLLDADSNAALIQYGEEGPMPEPSAGGDETFVLREGGVDRAATLRRGPWFVCLSAYTAPLSTSRWHQDRQNVVSIWHERTGLIVGGGNTKLQPAWSSITVGDESLLRHRPGDTQPTFLPSGKLFHVPSAATLSMEPRPGLQLKVGPEQCAIRVEVQDPRRLVYEVERQGQSDLPATAHLTLLPRLGKPLVTGTGRSLKLDAQPVHLGPAELGGVVRHAGFAIRLPAAASVCWPALPHNPYRADGHAELSEGRISIGLPLVAKQAQRVVIEVE